MPNKIDNVGKINRKYSLRNYFQNNIVTESKWSDKQVYIRYRYIDIFLLKCFKTFINLLLLKEDNFKI